MCVYRLSAKAGLMDMLNIPYFIRQTAWSGRTGRANIRVISVLLRHQRSINDITPERIKAISATLVNSISAPSVLLIS
jgi:hypothetical protein